VLEVGRGAWWLFTMATAFVSAQGCKVKASTTQCDELLDRYAQLVVIRQFPDASFAQVESAREREKSEARGDDAFKNCSSEVSQAEFDCAMRAPSSNAFEKCLE
jgi:hypothetical protein